MDGTPPRSGIRERLGLRPIINVSGTMTGLGASIVVPEAIAATTAILPEFVEINDLHRLASRTIARLTGAEAGFVTASCSAGITVAVAACMTGADLGRIEQLPNPSGMRARVPIMLGHMVGYGAPVEQAIRLAGATVVPFGQATEVRPYQLEAALDDNTACAVYVISHHCVGYGQLALDEFAAICRSRNVPVVVDAASEYDLRGFLAAGADLVCYSAHKFLGGPTAGIVTGRKDLVRATFAAMGAEPRIRFIDMPEGLAGRYQYFTEARMERLRDVGYRRPFTSLEDGVRAYVKLLEGTLA